jgi:hypothetical protein
MERTTHVQYICGEISLINYFVISQLTYLLMALPMPNNLLFKIK